MCQLRSVQCSYNKGQQCGRNCHSPEGRGADPPLFLARTPHGYNDIDLIYDEVKQAGFEAVEITTIADASWARSAEMLGWLVYEHGIEPHIPVFDKSKRRDGCFEKADFTYDHQADAYTCPAGKQLRPRRRACQRQSPLADADGRDRVFQHNLPGTAGLALAP